MSDKQTSYVERTRPEKISAQDRDFTVAELNAILNEVSRASAPFLEALEFKIQSKTYAYLTEHEYEVHHLLSRAFQHIIYGDKGDEILPSTPAKLRERCVEAEDIFPSLCAEYGIRLHGQETVDGFIDAFRKTYEHVIAARPADAVNRPPVLTHFRQ